MLLWSLPGDPEDSIFCLSFLLLPNDPTFFLFDVPINSEADIYWGKCIFVDTGVGNVMRTAHTCRAGNLREAARKK